MATRTGYQSAQIASMAVNALLQKSAVEQGRDHRRQTLDLELARLDALQSAYWPLAMAGDIAAGTFILRVITHRSLILGFAGAHDDLAEAHQTVVVVRGTEPEFIATLKAVVEGQASGGVR